MSKRKPKYIRKAPRSRLDKLLSDPKAITGILVAACVLALIAVVLILVSGRQEPEQKAFTPPPFEEAAVVGTPQVPEELGWSELAVRDGYVVHVCGVLDSRDGETVPVWFASDADNQVWLKLRLRDGETNAVLGQTGIIKPGEYVERLKLEEKAVSANVILEIMGYEPETYYSAGTVGLATTLSVAG